MITSTAEQIHAICQQYYVRMNISVIVAKNNWKENEFLIYRSGAAKVMGELYASIMLPLYRDYPHLENTDPPHSADIVTVGHHGSGSRSAGVETAKLIISLMGELRARLKSSRELVDRTCDPEERVEFKRIVVIILRAITTRIIKPIHTFFPELHEARTTAVSK